MIDRSSSQGTDRAGRSYWEQNWRWRPRQQTIDPRRSGIRNHLRRQFHAYFSEILGPGSGRRLLEIGCADSVWLPYFARELGFAIAGLDYSAEGCAKARDVLIQEGIDGTIHQADMFDALSSSHGVFDVVFSYGLIEHFEKTREAIYALSHFCRPGGLVLTLIPNMTGINGWLQRRYNAEVYNIHVPLSLRELVDAHEAAGLSVCDARALLSVNFGVIAATSPPDTVLSRLLKRVTHNLLLATMLPVWWLESHGVRPLPTTELLSPYFAVAARK